jgi:hypothetical protein
MIPALILKDVKKSWKKFGWPNYDTANRETNQASLDIKANNF